MASHISLPVKIPTAIPGLYLRMPRPTQHDAKGLSEIFGHKFNNRFEPERPGRKEPTPEMYMEKIPSWLEMAEKGQNCFCLLVLESEGTSDEGKIIGFGGINDLSSANSASEGGGGGVIKTADVGIMLHEPYTRKGYAAAALRATIDACFDRFAVDAVQAETFFINDPFRSLMRKLKLDQFSKIVSEEGPGEVAYSFTKEQWDSVR